MQKCQAFIHSYKFLFLKHSFMFNFPVNLIYVTNKKYDYHIIYINSTSMLWHVLVVGNEYKHKMWQNWFDKHLWIFF